MNKREFDHLIRKNMEKAFPEQSFGYEISGESVQDLYLTKESFYAFSKEMEEHFPDAYQSYAKGKGSELLERISGTHSYPPKMACVASSSRFCYLALRCGALDSDPVLPVKFEYSCPIDGVGRIPPQLDGCVPERNLFFEVKCHEIFDSHTVEMSNAYQQWLCSDQGFGISEVSSQNGKLVIPNSVFGIDKKSSRFDIKQLLCHLMGIASQKKECSELRYLFFKPKMQDAGDAADVESVFEELTWEIGQIFRSEPIARFCQSHRITLSAVAEYDDVMKPLKRDNMISLF